MACNDVLIVSPLNVKFQSPFPHVQRRQLSLLNLGSQPVDYSIAVDNETQFQVQPCCGRVQGFDTTELRIIMQPTDADQLGCSLTVKHMVNDVSGIPLTLEDWKDAKITVVEITLENSMENEKELLNLFGDIEGSSRDLIEIMEKQYQPLCHKCSMKRFQQPAKELTWMRHIWWPFMLALLSLLSYFLWELWGMLEFNPDSI